MSSQVFLGRPYRSIPSLTVNTFLLKKLEIGSKLEKNVMAD